MNYPEYSIVIRTLGKSGEKYRAMLDSIKNLSIKPKEIIVVLPIGYTQPEDRIGTETFVYSKKGMVQQRVYGAKQATTEYILFLDDDVSFEPCFVEKMMKPILLGMCDATVPPQFSMLPPKKGIKKIIPMIMLSAIPTVLNKDMYIKVLKSGGWSYNRFGKNVSEYLYTESAAGIGFLSKKEAFMNIKFDDESWLEDINYSLPEDQVMFYKYVVSGYRIICVTNAVFTHLDAGGTAPSRMNDAAYAMGRNKHIFWHDYIYCRQKKSFGKLVSVILYRYSTAAQKAYLLFSLKKEELDNYSKGLKDGKKFIRSKKGQLL